MNATQATIDIDDTEALLAADREGLLRAALSTPCAEMTVRAP